MTRHLLSDLWNVSSERPRQRLGIHDGLDYVLAQLETPFILLHRVIFSDWNRLESPQRADT